MRIHIHTTPNTQTVPFNYQSKLVGTLHKWLGRNELHGRLSFYSFSWLSCAERAGNGLTFPQGSQLFVSFYDSNQAQLMVGSILNDPDLFCGLEVTNVWLYPDPDLENQTVFEPASPIFIHRRIGNRTRHFTFNDPEADELLKETLARKMQQAGLPEDDTLRIRFDASDPRKKTKVVHYREIQNKANLCRVIVEGKPETKAFAWTVGLGSSTGIGFGALH